MISSIDLTVSKVSLDDLAACLARVENGTSTVDDANMLRAEFARLETELARWRNQIEPLVWGADECNMADLLDGTVTP